MKQVDVVICSIPSKHVLDQKLLIRLIKQAGCIKVVVCGSLCSWFILIIFICLMGIRDSKPDIILHKRSIRTVTFGDKSTCLLLLLL